MTDRVTTLLAGRRERLERLLGRTLSHPDAGSQGPASPKVRAFLLDEAEDLYWNELEWENITDEEALEEGPLTELTFPGFLAYLRGLLLREVMPDSLSPANPRPQVVGGVLDFLASRIVELGEGLEDEERAGEDDRLRAESEMTRDLVDRVLYLYHGLGDEEIEKVEAAQAAA